MTSSNGGISVLLSFCAGNSPATGGFSSQKDSKADLWCFFVQSEQTAKQTLDWLVIRDTMTVLSRRRNGGSFVIFFLPEHVVEQTIKLPMLRCNDWDLGIIHASRRGQSGRHLQGTFPWLYTHISVHATFALNDISIATLINCKCCAFSTCDIFTTETTITHTT